MLSERIYAYTYVMGRIMHMYLVACIGFCFIPCKDLHNHTYIQIWISFTYLSMCLCVVPFNEEIIQSWLDAESCSSNVQHPSTYVDYLRSTVVIHYTCKPISMASSVIIHLDRSLFPL